MCSKKSKGPVFELGLCRCCGGLKKCRLLNAEYEYFGQKEVYSDMLMDCYGLLLSHLDGKLTERLVCATCVQRLREALTFRRQVLRCEDAFLQMKMCEHEISEHPSLESEAPKITFQAVKEERDVSSREPSPSCDQLESENERVKSEDTSDESNSDEDLPISQRFKHKIAAKELKNNAKNKKPNDACARAPRVKKTKVKVAAKNAVSDSLKKDGGVEKCIVVPVNKKTQMSRLQQLNRERDVNYVTETNILTIVENSFVCPFKCRHNNLLCYYCGALCPDPKTLRQHTETHNPKKFKISEHKKMIKVDITRIDCRLCDEIIDSIDEFKTHIVKKHLKKYYFEYSDLVLPFRLTTDELTCVLCDHKFLYFHALNKHMNVHFSNYVCETCGLGFVDKSRFVMHLSRHEEGDYPCSTCGKNFKAQYNLDLHVDRVHNKKGRVYCPKCDVKLMSYPQKLKHLVEVHGEQPLSFPCNLCSKVCLTRRMLTIHRRKDHLKDFRYECQFCGQRFFTRFALTNHMPTHTGERNYKCKVCEKSYPRLKTLKDHMRIHTNDRRYSCHICAQAFIQNCSLKGHMKSQHPEYG